jgi:16S rRNA (adenine1518-N6/adenine1519-N6)-dimethyltransferase
VIRLTRNKTATLACDETLFFRVVKQSFGQRRKMLRKSLKQLLPKNTQILEEFLTKRPEMLSVEDFVNLTMKLTK